MEHHICPQHAAHVRKAIKMDEVRAIKLQKLCPALKFIASDKAGLETALLQQGQFMLLYGTSAK